MSSAKGVSNVPHEDDPLDFFKDEELDTSTMFDGMFCDGRRLHAHAQDRVSHVGEPDRMGAIDVGV